MKHFLSFYSLFLMVKLGHFGVFASNVDFIPRTIRRTQFDYGLNDIQEDTSNVNLLAVLFGDEFQAFYYLAHHSILT